MKKLNIEELKTMVLSVMLMIMGILFCCSLAIGISGLSVVLGLILMIIGTLYIVNSVLNNQGIFTISGILGTLILSIGILFIVDKLAGIIFAFIPWFLIIFGAVVILDAFLGKYLRNEEGNLYFIIKLIVGAVALILGLCLELITGFAEYASIILGILMIVYAVYMIFKIFTKGNSVEG